VPGAALSPTRLARLVQEGVARCRLDLTGRRVVTEAATGAYGSTCVLAAVAGADVTALARSSQYGDVAQVRHWVGELAQRCGVEHRLHVVEELSPSALGAADVVTNSGHLRPIDEAFLLQLRPGAVLPLMIESWEVGAGRVDLDVAAARRRGIAMAGTNERHPAVGVFDYLGVMAVTLLADAGVPVMGSNVLVLCDNPFADYLERTLRACGACVTVRPSATGLPRAAGTDAVLVALTPAPRPRLEAPDLAAIAERLPDAVVVQFFGDVDRAAAGALGVSCWPEPPPPHGHMGVLPSDIGPDPVVRLQAGGLKVAQVLLTPSAERTAADREFLDAF
jgi:hypothetical protein